MAIRIYRMASVSSALLLALLCFWSLRSCHARIFTFHMHHRFSDPVKRWSERAGKPSPAADWPRKGTAAYYAELADRDSVLHRRKLSRLHGPFTFSNGNSTLRINAMGFLHYTTLSLGTPPVRFLVALDTGSDLFWVPCDCSRCAPIEGRTYDFDFEFGIFNPRESLTSKKVNCNSILCAHRNRCLGPFGNCPYTVSYVSAETSTSGILIEDVLHLTTEGSHPEYVKTYITFGCGQVQTGSFLDIAAPNGLLGLGMEKISVPSILSRKGYMADSFSMCFGRDGIGRIRFGDKGSPDQEETPFNVNPSHPAYIVTVSQIQLGTTLIDLEFTALFDSGTSFTYLVSPLYTRLSKSFHSLTQDTRRSHDPGIPFEYCYDTSPDSSTSLMPTLSITMKGGSQFTVYDPIIVISSQSELAYCLAVLRSTEMNIIGQNFMTGYRVVFDRERFIIGWKSFDCYDIEVEDSDSLSIEPDDSASMPPADTVGVINHTSRKSAALYRNQTITKMHLSFTLLFILFLLL